jgi:hypothetical protein
MPGLLSGIASIILCSMPAKSLYEENLTDKCLHGGVNRTPGIQAGYQCAGLILTIVIAVVGGLLTGIFLRLPIFSTPDNDSYFDDSLNWHVPTDFVSEDSALATLMKSLRPNPLLFGGESNNPNTIEIVHEASPKSSIHSQTRSPKYSIHSQIGSHHKRSIQPVEQTSPALYIERL